MGLSLNLGCGGGEYLFKDLSCSINCDIDIPKTKIENFVRCDAHHLPFRPCIFSFVEASHIIEHLDGSHKAISEMKRVCRGEIHLSYPYFLSPFAFLEKRHKWLIVGQTFIPIPNRIRKKKVIDKLFLLRAKINGKTKGQLDEVDWLSKRRIIRSEKD
ncbi:MAG: methyltransferase domain-containing protein [Candidatus Bathyarchaeota archaeon]